METARPEFGHLLLNGLLRHSFGDPPGPPDQFFARQLQQPLKFFIQLGFGPTGLLKDAAVLRGDDQDRIGGQDQLGMGHSPQAGGKRAGQRVREARLLIENRLDPGRGK